MAFFSKVYGTSHKNPDGSDRQEIIRKHCRPGMRLILRPEPDNKYDPYAIGLWIEVRSWWVFTKELQVGYINQDFSDELANHLIAGGSIVITISAVTGGGKKS